VKMPTIAHNGILELSSRTRSCSHKSAADIVVSILISGMTTLSIQLTQTLGTAAMRWAPKIYMDRTAAPVNWQQVLPRSIRTDSRPRTANRSPKLLCLE
jgi:hypothetical protein